MSKEKNKIKESGIISDFFQYDEKIETPHGTIYLEKEKYFIRPEKTIEDFPNGGYVDYVLKNLIMKPWNYGKV